MDLNLRVLVARARASIGLQSDGIPFRATADSYGRSHVGILTATDFGAADEGSYFVASSGAAGTAIADQTTNTPNNSVPSDTAPALIIQNGNAVGGANIWVRRIYRRVISPGTASQTAVIAQLQLDNGLIGVTGGTELTGNSKFSLNPRGLNQTNARIWVGALTKAAKTGSVLFPMVSALRSTIAIAGDENIFKFGSAEDSSTLSSAAGAQRIVIVGDPIMIPPQWTLSLHFAYGLTVTGSPTSDWTVGYIER